MCTSRNGDEGFVGICLMARIFVDGPHATLGALAQQPNFSALSSLGQT